MALWQDFRDSYLDSLFNYELREVKAENFMNLKQGKITVKEYVLNFHQLSHYAPVLVFCMRATIRQFSLVFC